MFGRFLKWIRPPACYVYCWRCGRFVRGLTEWEHFCYENIFYRVKRDVDAAIARGEVFDENREAELTKPMKDACREYSGEDGIDPGHLFKHRIKSFGPPCRGCGRNLRTPKAKKCMECGRPK